LTDTPSLPPGTLLAGKFRIERLLGAGAMGAVYLIEHELTHHKRALKLLHPEVVQVPDIVRRFLAEASAAGRAGSPHLVETFDAGTLPTGEPYVVMEMLSGETLGSLLERHHRLDPAYAAEFVAQAAEGIEAAHRAGIIHRDLKPENLFVTEREGRPFIKILDFGVSKFQQPADGTPLGATRTGTIVGSPSYMSPEQIVGDPDIDARTDVFALGVVLYQCLSGALPFEAPTLHALTLRLLTGDLTPIETLMPGLPPAMVEVVRRALSKERAGRFPTAQALADALAPMRNSQVTFTPPSLVAGAPHAPHADAMQASFAATAVAPSQSAIGTSSQNWSSSGAIPRKSRWPAVIAIAATLLGGLGAFVVVRTRAPMAPATEVKVAPTPATTAPPPAATIAPPEPSHAPPPEPAVTLAPPSATHAPAPPPRPAASTRASPDPGSSAPATKAPTAPPASSAAQGLGLRQDNPFR
jgi:serine/threonine protein kinase